MTDDNDGMGDTLDSNLRTALAVAMQLAQRFAQLREELVREAQDLTEQETRELGARFDAERSAAAASLAPVHLPEWWSHASVDDIAGAYETAESWRMIDTDVARSSDHIREEISVRFGVDVNDPHADPAQVRFLLERIQRNRAEATIERVRRVSDGANGTPPLAAVEQLESDSEDRDQDQREEHVTAGADAPKRMEARSSADRRESALAYDSAERRQKRAAELKESGLHPALVRVRVVSDLDNATHPSAAVDSKPGEQRRARAAGQSHAPQRERGGLSR